MVVLCDYDLAAQGCKPQLLPFPPYTCAQIGAVLRARLSQLPGKVFTPPAVMLCARKVCSQLMPVGSLLVRSQLLHLLWQGLPALDVVACHPRSSISNSSQAY